MSFKIPSTGWTLVVRRQRTERRESKNFSRTVGTYQVYRDGQPVSALAGMTVEREGPGDNGLVGKEDHRCIEAGIYPLAMHHTGNYSTNRYETDGEHPRPAVLVGDTAERTGILVHPASGYGSTIGCFNLAGRLQGPDANLSLADSTRRVIAVIEDLRSYTGGFPDGTFPNARIIVVDAAIDQVGRQALRLGSRGPLVAAWQAFLNGLGASLGAPDGRFGVDTQRATIAFQQTHGLSVDGMVGPKSIEAARALGFGTAPDAVAEAVFGAESPLGWRAASVEIAAANALAEAVEEVHGIDLTPGQRRICERVINVFETGTIGGRYGAISIFPDGPHQIRQITYGRAQTTEYGNLRELVEMYANAGGTFSAALAPYVAKIKNEPLVDNNTFKSLLRRAGNEDPVMAQTQDVFFDRRYFQPAMKWATEHGFTKPLSMLVIYDSFVHSGGILGFLRARFAERVPSEGGNEKKWIHDYVEVRHNWLRTHSNPVLRPTIYRTRDLMREIQRNNWDLSKLPISANGTSVTDAPDAILEVAIEQAGFAAVDAVDVGALAAEVPPQSGGYIWQGLDKSTFLRRNRARLRQEIDAVNSKLDQIYGSDVVHLSEQDVWVLTYIEAGLTNGKVDPNFRHSLGERGMLPLPDNITFWNGAGAPNPKQPMPLETNLHHFYLYLGQLMNKPVRQTPRFMLYSGLFRHGPFPADPLKKVQLLAGVVHGYFLSQNYSDRRVPFDHVLDGFARGDSADVVMRPTRYVHAGSSIVANRARNIAEALTLLDAAGQEAVEIAESFEIFSTSAPAILKYAVDDTPAPRRSTRYKLKFREKQGMQAALSGPESISMGSRLTDWKENMLALEAEPGQEHAKFEDEAHKMAAEYGADIVPDRQYDIDDAGLYEAGPESDTDPTLEDVISMIRADEVWGQSRGAGVTIAILDTGVDGSRPEFRNKVGWHRGLSAGANLNPWEDGNGHGTMCAAIAAGQTGQGTARNGVAPDAGILPCRTSFYDSEIIYLYNRLIERAQSREIIVASNSFGTKVGDPPPIIDRQLIDKLREAEAAGIHIFFSAGNNHELTGSAHSSCAPNSIWLHKSYEFLTTVGTCDLDSNLWSYSSRGPGQFYCDEGTRAMPDVIAPTPRNGRIAYGRTDRTLPRGWGTSGACPQVAGLAALILSLDHSLSPAEVRELIRGAAKSIGLGATCQGKGLIDCAAAFALV